MCTAMPQLKTQINRFSKSISKTVLKMELKKKYQILRKIILKIHRENRNNIANITLDPNIWCLIYWGFFLIIIFTDRTENVQISSGGSNGIVDIYESYIDGRRKYITYFNNDLITGFPFLISINCLTTVKFS